MCTMSQHQCAFSSTCFPLCQALFSSTIVLMFLSLTYSPTSHPIDKPGIFIANIPPAKMEHNLVMSRRNTNTLVCTPQPTADIVWTSTVFSFFPSHICIFLWTTVLSTLPIYSLLMGNLIRLGLLWLLVLFLSSTLKVIHSDAWTSETCMFISTSATYSLCRIQATYSLSNYWAFNLSSVLLCVYLLVVSFSRGKGFALVVKLENSR